jgi:hypothetical protein
MHVPIQVHAPRNQFTYTPGSTPPHPLYTCNLCLCAGGSLRPHALGSGGTSSRDLQKLAVATCNNWQSRTATIGSRVVCKVFGLTGVYACVCVCVCARTLQGHHARRRHERHQVLRNSKCLDIIQCEILPFLFEKLRQVRDHSALVKYQEKVGMIRADAADQNVLKSRCPPNVHALCSLAFQLFLLCRLVVKARARALPIEPPIEWDLACALAV